MCGRGEERDEMVLRGNQAFCFGYVNFEKPGK